jgi:hypothetical protein
MRILESSRPYMYISLDGPDTAGDLTQYPVQVALIPDNGSEPGDGDWHDADWIDGQAALLLGPGSPAGAWTSGDYYAFARITAGLEELVLPSGRVRVGM